MQRVGGSSVTLQIADAVSPARPATPSVVTMLTAATLATGAPVLADCSVAFDCRIAAMVNVGTHDVLFCRVVAVQRSGCTDNLINFGRAYHTVGVTSPAGAGAETALRRS